MISIGISLFILFVLLAFFEGAEMAMLSCNKLRLKHLADSGQESAKIIYEFQRKPQWILTTILIGTNIAHVALVALFTYAMGEYFNIQEEWLVTLILTPLIIIFAETIPKDWFRQKADEFIYWVGPILLFFEKIFSPLIKYTLKITDFMVGLVPSETHRNPFVTKDEFRMIVNESAQGGVLHEHEKHLIHTILDLGSMTVKDVMTDFKQFPQIELSGKIKDIKTLARQSKKPIVLVYEEIPSIVVGVVYVFDILFEANEEAGLRQYLRSPLFVPQDTSVEKTILLMQSKHSSYAVATNVEHEIVGVIAIENLIKF